LSQNRLLLLGLLQVQDRHGYELMDVVDRQLAAFTNLKKASAYYELNRMAAEGLIAARTEAQEGRPPRRIFAVTPAGQAAFRDLLREALSQPQAESATADMGLMFLDWLPREEAAGLLQTKVAVLAQSLEACRSMPSHGAGSAVDLTTAHLAARLEFEIGWHQSLIERLKTGEEQA
jgi:DNA-binding PadR family transcriptional regulator